MHTHYCVTVLFYTILFAVFASMCPQVVCLREVFPYSAGIVLAFEYMPTDLASVLRNSERRLSEVCVGEWW